MIADDIAVAHTPEGGWHGEMPPPILWACTEPLAPGAPDLRGVWKAYVVAQGGRQLIDHPLNRHMERIEQCGNRVVITAGRVVHDMRADGTLEHGVNDVLELDLTQKIQVAAVFNNGRLDLHPGGVDPTRPPFVTRELVDGELVWHYAAFTVTMRKVRARGERS
jgi:hypothetical protein